MMILALCICIRYLLICLFRIYYEDGVTGHEASLRSHLTSLRQDKALRSALEPSLSILLSTPRLQPGSPIHNCLLSIL